MVFLPSPPADWAAKELQGCWQAGLCWPRGEGAPLPPRALLFTALLISRAPSAPTIHFAPSAKLRGDGGWLPASVEEGWRGNRNLEGKNNPRNSLPPPRPRFLWGCQCGGDRFVLSQHT